MHCGFGILCMSILCVRSFFGLGPHANFRRFHRIIFLVLAPISVDLRREPFPSSHPNPCPHSCAERGPAGKRARWPMVDLDAPEGSGSGPDDFSGGGGGHAVSSDLAYISQKVL